MKYIKGKIAIKPIVVLIFSLGLPPLAWSIDLASWFSSDEEEPVSAMSLDESRQLIADGNDLDAIPKEHWKQLLNAEQYEVLWEQGTERAFTGSLLHEKREGVFVSAGCKIPVFRSEHKFKSGTGWPSFWEVFDSKNVRLVEDRSWGMRRVEIVSACGEHLGHVFDDGPEPTGLRYCINSLALEFVPKENTAKLLIETDVSSSSH